MTNREAIEEVKNYDNYPNRLSRKCRDYILKVLKQEPRKGHWILTDVEGNRVWYCHCSECGKDPQDYIGGSENWWLIKNKLPKFCPSCGSDNSEAKEK